MPLDVDYIAAMNALGELNHILDKIPHGKRESIADDYIAFVEFIKSKYTLETQIEIVKNK